MAQIHPPARFGCIEALQVQRGGPLNSYEALLEAVLGLGCYLVPDVGRVRIGCGSWALLTVPSCYIRFTPSSLWFYIAFYFMEMLALVLRGKNGLWLVTLILSAFRLVCVLLPHVGA